MSQGPYGQYPPQGYPQQQGYSQQQGYPQQQWSGGQAYPPPQQAPNDDEQHLNVLSICTFCYAGLVALIGLVFSIYLIIGVIIAGAAVSTGGSGSTEAGVMGGVFIVFGLLAMLFTFGKAALLVFSGVSMRKRSRPTLSFVVACISCLNIPLGTALGVFTLIVLNRPSVKALYAKAAMQAV